MLNDNGGNHTLIITIERIDYNLTPEAKLSFKLWGPARVSPGQNVNYTIRYLNTGLKTVHDVIMELQLHRNVTYVSSTGGGIYNSTTHGVTWQKTIPAVSYGYLGVWCRVDWGLPLEFSLDFHLYTDSWREVEVASTISRVLVAKDPNIKYGPEGNVTRGQTLDYMIEYENEGKGVAYGVYFTDILDTNLDDSTLKIGPLKSKTDNSVIAPPGIYNPATRTITWFAGEVGPGEGGYTELWINVRDDALHKTAILNYATVYFPSVPEITLTNGIISLVRVNQGPHAIAGGDREALTFQDIVFDASQSFDVVGEIINYSWDFGDGEFGYGKNVIHSYMDDGVYAVKLTVEDDDGSRDTQDISVTIKNRVPGASINADKSFVKTYENITFYASNATDLDGRIVGYYFDFGDGTNSGTFSKSVITHQYTDGPRKYDATLTVKDDDGDTATSEISVYVENRPPVVIPGRNQTVYVGAKIFFSSWDAFDRDGSIVSYRWDFGDGTIEITASPTHTYAEPGMYNVNLSAADDDGAEGNGGGTIIVLSHRPVASFTVNLEQGGVDTWFEFNSSSYDRDGYVTRHSWDFGDGNHSMKTDPVHQYVKAGIYTVTLQVEDNTGESSDKFSRIITVINSRPVAKIGKLPPSAVIGEKIIFNGSGSFDIDGEAVTCTWDFGDGSTGAGKILFHYYSGKGTYTVTLTVVDESGNEGKTSTVISIRERSVTEDSKAQNGPSIGITAAMVAAIIMVLTVILAMSLRKKKYTGDDNEKEEE